MGWGGGIGMVYSQKPCWGFCSLLFSYLLGLHTRGLMWQQERRADIV